MTTPDEALIPATEIPGPLIEPFLPRGFEPGSSAQIVDGIPAWFTFNGDECDYDELYVHTHREDRALEIAAQLARECDGSFDRPEIAETGWCFLVTECGCTPERHAAHADLDAGCEADCKHPDLPPCNSDPVYGWMVDKVLIGTPGALPYMRVVLS